MAKQNIRSRAVVKGQPNRYIVGHVAPKTKPRPTPVPRVCECGCGQATTISDRTYGKIGVRAGDYHRMVRGHKRPVDPASRLWARVAVGAPDACWEWQGAREWDGYGKIGIKVGTWRWTTAPAHRLAWELANGPIPDGLLVLHRCDNPPCCNPAHLFLGTNADNTHDMIAKGRARGRFSKDKAGASCG